MSLVPSLLVASIPCVLCQAAGYADGAANGLLIVAPASLAPVAQEYAHDRGPSASVTVLEEALATHSEGADDAERLKRFLFDRWRAGVTQVLLVGDASVLPTRYMVLDRVTQQAFDYAFYPSDLYYADVARSDGSFDDWNAEKDGFHASYFGEIGRAHV